MTFESSKETVQTKSAAEALKESLFYKKTNVWEASDAARRQTIFDYAENYKKYLDASKTEREAVETSVAFLEKAGYRPYKWGEALSAGDKIYYVNRQKSLIACRIGTGDPEEDGYRIAAAHIDSPRLDIKQNPLYEDSGMCFMKTHYYGGIKKYQWTAVPLALHGVIIRKDGTSVSVCIGEDEGEPLFYINDLLPHLGAEQAKQPLGSAIAGETLNLLVGGLPYPDEKIDDKIKLNVLALLHEKYGVTEEDFISAELSAVPAYRARDIGFDRALIGSYGHDDRVCAYPALTALAETEDTRHTLIVILSDKEEIGSVGNTGMQSHVFADFMEAVARAFGADFARVRNASLCLSADVCAAFDPNFAEVYERRNSAMISSGTSMAKHTGSRGKSGANDASAETVSRIRRMFANNGVVWQTAELGKVDAGGGGTVAMFIANLGINTVDLGVPVISMHAPYEVISKADLYTTHEALAAFYKED